MYKIVHFYITFFVHSYIIINNQEYKYETIDELILAIDDYINYYNYDRIKVKLKGLSPVNYRLQSLNSPN